ncbi:MAG: 2Fe-2S iron-sulfur cluster binding domain-containing protein [Candidatus Latescibacteria bacterium]|nr:2Fe-2S iron-sulfur cluster binding domain-containing protein [Candidatus Latescibacterota bacterium]
MLVRILDSIPILGFLIASAVFIQVVLVLYSSFRRHRTALRLLQQRVEDAKAAAGRLRVEWERAQALTDLSWNGYRKFKVERKVYEDALARVCSFYFAPHDGRPLPPFKPGQFLTFQLHLNDPRAGHRRNRPAVRCYSLSDSPRPDYYRVSIKRLAPTPDRSDLAPGLVSNFFHDRVQEGDILDIKAPSGDFFLDMTKQTPVVLIGGGVGVTPMLSMLNTLIDSGSRRETWFFYGARNSREQIMRASLDRIAREHENIRLHLCYSAPGEDDVQGKDYHHGERISIGLLKRLLPSNNYQFYLCGPASMMTALIDGLRDWGVPDDDIKFEAFSPASVKQIARSVAETGAVPGPGMTVTFSQSGKRVVWDPSVGSLLEFAEANGVTIDSGCRVGNCQTCLTAIKEGEVRYIHAPNPIPEAGTCLTCIAVPKGHVVLDA